MKEEQDQYGPQDMASLDREIEDTIHKVILACGDVPPKEKVSLLYLSIDYIFYHNKELFALFTGLSGLH